MRLMARCVDGSCVDGAVEWATSGPRRKKLIVCNCDPASTHLSSWQVQFENAVCADVSVNDAQ